jgi:ATP-dependent Clp protease ATP-binding subunit ClpB
MIQDPLALRILKGEFKAGDHVLVDEGPDGNVLFTRSSRPAEAAARETVH